jgi:hypothetical protein
MTQLERRLSADLVFTDIDNAQFGIAKPCRQFSGRHKRLRRGRA